MSPNDEFLSLIYHEKQESALCAIHCLNNLLQQKALSEEDFTEIARSLDEKEEKLMSEMGVDTQEYRDYQKDKAEKGSENISDDGFFSVQVLSNALDVYNLSITDINHPSMAKVKSEPYNNAKAFVCNHQQHWFTLRKFGSHWFDLNSLAQQPIYISNTYLSLFLEQCRREGYTVFVVDGVLPSCDADQTADVLFHPAKNIIQTAPVQDDSDDDLQRAIMQSLCDNEQVDDDDDLEAQIQEAIRMSKS
ncbi:ataxin [Acrasis kona]|uniref:ubiquitinyl hydrolase 1 n=1 Tax=Acrasis kona TaxID=1008807 RepID=A0AAW2ZMI9_9EUKA